MNLSIIIPSHNEPNIEAFANTVSRQFPNSQVIVSKDPEGKGKGWAIRKGLEQATGDIICFLDGDGDIHPSMINRLLPFLDHYDIVCAAKDMRGFLTRSLITILSRIYIQILFGLDVDSQTGLKVFKRYVIPTWETNGFLFDAEILAKAKRSGATMADVPIAAYIRRRVKIKSLWITFIESLRLWKSLNR